MSAVFWFIAGVTAGVAVAIVAIPLWRAAGNAPRRPPLHYAAVGCGIAIFVAAAALLYRTLGHPGSLDPTMLAERPAQSNTGAGSPGGGTLPGKARSMESATAGLEARLARGGGSAADWTLLAQSYEFLGRTADAQRAREHLVSAGGSSTGVRSTAASAAGEPAAGRSVPGPPADSRLDSPNTNIALVWEAAASGTAAAAPVQIDGTVTIEPRFASRVERDATLFIYAKAVDAPGPPLAVMRTIASAWPVTFRLDDSMAMLPSRKLSQFDKVVIEARISRTGQAAPAPGDLYVTSDVLRPTAGKKLALVINHEIG
jgi:cytochrome c-type biogenesis protein CcmH